MQPKYTKFILETSGYGLIAAIAVTFIGGPAKGIEAGLLAAGLIALTKGLYFVMGAILGFIGFNEFNELTQELKNVTRHAHK